MKLYVSLKIILYYFNNIYIIIHENFIYVTIVMRIYFSKLETDWKEQDLKTFLPPVILIIFSFFILINISLAQFLIDID